MPLFFTEHSKWEHEFITIELLAGIDLTHKNVLIINHATAIEQIKCLVDELKPFVVFHLSDERGELPDWPSNMFGSAKYVFRQYNHPHYLYPPNSVQIPLGYASGYNKTDKVRPIIERLYKAAFIGELKSDRHDMFDEFERGFDTKDLFFKATTNTWDLSNLHFSPTATNEVYSDAVFVPIGRGYQSLDCFRFYEAIVSGAIPVIVGDRSEATTTFWYGGIMPSFVCANTWAEACNLCKAMIKDKNPILQIIQSHNIEWWRTQIDGIRNKIES